MNIIRFSVIIVFFISVNVYAQTDTIPNSSAQLTDSLKTQTDHKINSDSTGVNLLQQNKPGKKNIPDLESENELHYLLKYAFPDAYYELKWKSKDTTNEFSYFDFTLKIMLEKGYKDYMKYDLGIITKYMRVSRKTAAIILAILSLL